MKRRVKKKAAQVTSPGAPEESTNGARYHNATEAQFALARAQVDELRRRGIWLGGPWMSILDITSRANKCARNTALLYKRLTRTKADDPAYSGVLKMADGQTFWVSAWPRVVNSRPVVEIRLLPKTE